VLTYGYRPFERGIILKNNELADESFKINRNTVFRDSDRVVMRRSLGCHVEGAALPVPDVNYAPDQASGVVKRVAARMPKINRTVLRKFKRFVRRWMCKNLSEHVFKNDEMFEFDDWISQAPYPDYRKKELKKVYVNCKLNKVKKSVKCFIKDENYVEYKHMRGIYSRDDDYKVRVGPFFKKLGDVIFSLPWFIKKIPVNDRPMALLNKFKDSKNIFCTDFSQFEATFVKELMSVELMIYRFMLKDHPLQKEICDLIVSGMMSMNYLEFHTWKCRVMCKRMSGEMSTSVSNGMMNLLITQFLLEEKGNKNFDCFIEGDDCISSYDVAPPTSEDYKSLGGVIKIERPNNLCEASFCGQIFDPVDLDNVANPVEALVSFGWTGRSYLTASNKAINNLIRVKSLSLLYEYSGCPILRSLALYGLRVTNDVSIAELNKWINKQSVTTYVREQWIELLENFDSNKVFENTVKFNTRKLVEYKFGIDVQHQLAIEEYLNNKNDISPIKLDILSKFFNKDWLDYYNTYMVSCDYLDIVNKKIPKVYVTTGYVGRY